MQQLLIENFGFRYATGQTQALCGVSLTVHAGEFIVLCGPSGCGKTTLLRAIHPALAPAGTREGRILWNGVPAEQLDQRTAAAQIGVVPQEPESGIVTDKVWHELAFALENLGLPTAEIRMRVAEMAQYFGLDSLFDAPTDTLSGGQKQVLNLAASAALRPQLLLLDEPTAQLDPIAAAEFLATLARLNRELGLTVILSEHRLEDAFCYADRVVVLENGRIAADAPPAALASDYERLDPYMRAALPTAARVFAALPGTQTFPLTVKEAADRLTAMFAGRTLQATRIARTPLPEVPAAIALKNVSFRYEKHGADLLKQLDWEVPAGRVTALLGGNGAGKSTLLRLLAGIERPVGGRCRVNGKTALLPQHAGLLFTAATVAEELPETPRTAEIKALTQLEGMEARHPYDLSGGEQQRLALAKLLLTAPDILLLDEPTKGMDCVFKQTFAALLQALKAQGKTILLVSHDAEFCAAYADHCALLFDGEIACMKETAAFFCENFFYTTAANRLSRRLFENCVTDREVLALCRKNL